MIAHLRGRILSKTPQEAVIEVGGVGYRVAIPVSTFYRLGEEGADVALRVHTHVREDALTLFGFSTPLEQDLFEKLIAVAGVGPKLALNVLSGIEAPDLIQALRTSDVARLKRVPGVGKKTAERLVLELKDKVRAVTSTEQSAPQAGSRDDVISALTNLGYSRAEAERSVARAAREGADEGFEELLRRALLVLAGR